MFPVLLFADPKIGDLIYLHVLGHPMVVLSSLDVVRDLLDKRSSIYSDRPRFVLFSELYVRSSTQILINDVMQRISGWDGKARRPMLDSK